MASRLFLLKCELVWNYIRNFETDNLAFIKSDIEKTGFAARINPAGDIAVYPATISSRPIGPF